MGLGSNALDLVGVLDGPPEPDTKAPLLEFEVQGGGMVATAMVSCARPGLVPKSVYDQIKNLVAIKP